MEFSMQTYFDQLDRVRYEGPKSTNPLAFRHYNPDELVLGKRMEDHLRFAACYWHTFCWNGADMFGVGYYHRHAEWKYLFRLIPWAIIGIGIALWVGEVVNDDWFKNIIAILVFVCIGLMLWKDRRKENNLFPDTRWFAATMGVLGGFATMIGNVAGPIFAIYLLAMYLQKNKFIGTGAWFFFIINLTKFPLHVFIWKTISWHSLGLNLSLLPGIALGAFTGIWLVKKFSDHVYRNFVFIATALSAFLLFI